MVMRALLAGRSITTRLTEAWLSFFFRKSRTSMSSFSMPAKFWLLANHLEDQFLFTQRRKPRGSIFCPMLLSLVAHGQRDVAGLLLDAVATTLGTGSEALQARALVHVNRRHLQGVDVSAFVVLGVSDGAFQHLLQQHSALFRAEGQDVQRSVNRQAANLVGHQAALLCRQASVLQNSRNSHRITLPFGLLVGRVAFEGASQGKFTQLVT